MHLGIFASGAALCYTTPEVTPMDSDRIMHQALALVRVIRALDDVEMHGILERVVIRVLQFVYMRRLQWLAIDASMPERVERYVVNVARPRAARGTEFLPTIIGGWW